MPILSLDFFAGGGWLDKTEVFFIPFIAASVILFSISFFSLSANILMKTFLNMTMVGAVFLGIPNITWPIGSEWYESIELGFGLLSGMLMLFNAALFFCYKALKINQASN